MTTKYELLLAGFSLIPLMQDFNLGMEMIGHIYLHDVLINLFNEITQQP